jgi:hypothetical protein
MFNVFYHELTLTDASNRNMSLDGTPVSAVNVALDLIGGTAQALNGDFQVDGTSNPPLIKWDSTSDNLYNQMAYQDKVRVIYDRS